MVWGPAGSGTPVFSVVEAVLEVWACEGRLAVVGAVVYM
jgi:hypothetical protein